VFSVLEKITDVSAVSFDLYDTPSNATAIFSNGLLIDDTYLYENLSSLTFLHSLLYS
jgi:hypothetical protein